MSRHTFGSKQLLLPHSIPTYFWTMRSISSLGINANWVSPLRFWLGLCFDWWIGMKQSRMKHWWNGVEWSEVDWNKHYILLFGYVLYFEETKHNKLVHSIAYTSNCEEWKLKDWMEYNRMDHVPPRSINYFQIQIMKFDYISLHFIPSHSTNSNIS